MVKNWERHGVISVRAKALATVMMSLLFGYTLIFVNVPIWIKVIVSLIGIAVMIFIHTRPSSPQDSKETQDHIDTANCLKS